MSVSMMIEKREVKGLSGFMHALSSVSVDLQEAYKGDERFKKKGGFQGKINEEKALNSCSSSSSIGKNSDVSEGSMEKSDDCEEVQSPYKGPLTSMEALGEVLPIRKGISRFYNGKSKSFTSLREASTSSSMKELAKPENAYIRKRRNTLGCGLAWESNKNRGGISKRVTNSSRSTLALAAAMNSVCDNSNTNTMLSSLSRSSAPSVVSPLNPHFKEYKHKYCNGFNSPLGCGNFSGWRSYSLADLQQCEFVSVTTSSTLQAASAKVEKEPT